MVNDLRETEGDKEEVDIKMTEDPATEQGLQEDSPGAAMSTAAVDTNEGTEREGLPHPPASPSRSLLLSQALKTGTAESHSAAESVHFVKNFIRGKIDRDLFAQMTVGLYHVYVALEEELNRHGPDLFPTLHHPDKLSRVDALEDDVEFYHGVRWRDLPGVGKPSPATADYVERIRSVARTEPLLLIGHAYTRYLGDLSGGKVLARIARRALGLGGSEDGLRFYSFDRIKSAKEFKDSYRRALDGLDLDACKVEMLVAEANVAFALNMRVFEELDVAAAVEGAQVRDLTEATKYADRIAAGKVFENPHRKRMGGGDSAKCPFAALVAQAGKDLRRNIIREDGDAGAVSGMSKASGDSISSMKRMEGTRCPWPFVFFHDSTEEMKDWQTWAVLGLGMCWVWSRVCIWIN